jgi:uncharacterized protein YjiS (DUF1127 family)
MTTMAIRDLCWEPPTLNLTVRLPRILWTYLRWREERRLLRHLARLPDHLIRDMGFDPDEVRGTISGVWDVGLLGRSSRQAP